ncbi:unnamed protein product [Boreogadus saida]
MKMLFDQSSPSDSQIRQRCADYGRLKGVALHNSSGTAPALSHAKVGLIKARDGSLCTTPPGGPEAPGPHPSPGLAVFMCALWLTGFCIVVLLHYSQCLGQGILGEADPVSLFALRCLRRPLLCMALSDLTRADVVT